MTPHRWHHLIGTLAIALAGTAQAASCSMEGGPEQQFLGASLLFRGKLIDQRELSEAERSKDPKRPSTRTLRGRYLLLESFKGPAAQAIITVDSPAGGDAAGGFNDAIGTERLMVALGQSGSGYWSDLCLWSPGPELLQKHQAERRDFEARIKTTPDDPALQQAYGSFLLRAQSFEQAAQVFDTLLQGWPAEIDARLGLAQARFGLGHHDQALGGFEAVLAEQRENAPALRGRSEALMRMGRYAELAQPGLALQGYQAAQGEAGNFSGKDLRGAQFQSARLHSFDFSGADLRDSDFRDAKLDNSSFVGAKLDGARFAAAPSTADGAAPAGTVASLSGVDFSRSELRQLDLSRLRLSQARFVQARLQQVNLRQAQLSGSDWQGSQAEALDLSGAQLDGANLRGASFSHSDLRGVSFAGYSSEFFTMADLRGTDLSSARLDLVRWMPTLIDCHTRFPADLDLRTLPLLPLWQGCEGNPPLTGLSQGHPYAPRQRQTYPAYASRPGISFHHFAGQNMPMQDRNLAGYNVSDSDFSGSDFSRADLSDLAIDHSNFEGSDFRQANLQRARFWKVSLRGSDWRGADLRGAIFLDLDLRSTQLASARFEGACYNAATRWPAGFQARKAGLRRCEVS
ncbi:pentapeptide repeat-containing protein [Paucibacter sp. Y2R2-4]|uniref:pentapeptide repeat-containing protein n=1 Tax=Paucibacter sp. Y2R2-4 TaxID=2893553 RepID=UPI0021E3B924|nr:pentapeptide repeat-containing protein [Paucibacter sp. Y2R2-4]MCV2351387.1 pentapeptide repeat-containing protein [Paucibacter sp. Y2R2-4]